MIKPLRKRHLQIWMTLAVLLPVGIVFAWLVIPNQPSVKLLQAPATELLPVVKRTADRENYIITLRSNEENTKWQLEWRNKTILTVPSAVIYKVNESNDDMTNWVLIGRIETKGRYIFQLEPDSNPQKQLKLVLYDFIHEQKIDSINL